MEKFFISQLCVMTRDGLHEAAADTSPSLRELEIVWLSMNWTVY
tara:strand:- start:579 stop:710 length:132 start_codon:yes stop_codon:yes gene_type:complete